MKEIKAVIGKNFGDEGKGQLVNDLSREAAGEGRSVLVVRHNGGAQAGHTVEEKGFRFVFHQLGSGSRQGARTFWSRTFLPDLLKLGEEAEDFAAETEAAGGISADPHIFADGDCSCVTVYDVLLNSFAEEARGNARHGSCGMGIYEAERRSGREENTIRLGALCGAGPERVAQLLRRLRDGYVFERAAELEKELFRENAGDSEWMRLIRDENVLYNAAELMWENFNRYVTVADFRQLFAAADTVIFENAQGLLLDRDNEEYYPHLTPSHTGLFNIIELLRDVGWTPWPDRLDLPERDIKRKPENEKLPPGPEVWYVTRSYVTRHGAGRLDYECSAEEICPGMTDLTNTPNRWQESLRYARHPCAEEFLAPVRRDLHSFHEAFGVLPRTVLYLTHLDETEGKVLLAQEALTVEELRQSCEGFQILESGAFHFMKDTPAEDTKEIPAGR